MGAAARWGQWTLSAVVPIRSAEGAAPSGPAAGQPAASCPALLSPSARAVPLPGARGMVVVTGREPDSRPPAGAMSSSDAEDDSLEPATPTATQAGHALPLLPQEFPEVVPLNIGGAHFTTRLSTLRRYEDTMLAAMFSGRHYIPTDAEGRYFIDRDGTHFGDVLNFLRSGDLPPWERVRAVYKEAQYYAIGALLEELENMQPLKGEKVRQAFLGLMPYYKEPLPWESLFLLHPAITEAPLPGPSPPCDGRCVHLRRPSGADRGDRPAACGAAEGPLRQAQGLRLQGGDAHHALRVSAPQLLAL
ncbi:BTB/POZ domain-containing protein KCTD7 isoform X4 [Loxodonta africana]|uniref:BTB/POZ domain-containing protein KCTD7 isoform X4 n=1 Tax=Loxodonta africana TaxID=9785 RepID=UPI0030CC2E6B